ncbi:putative sodium:dicarboxylate symporter family protein [Streptococcus pneumoniae]|nr:putative sodium:dicarboxylate symporter family protein [Streptococcus pneumoniae]CIT65261.1 putative sodium:dicarboxylate symporter family protein [Streptococcus pneumoniae]CIW63096.1 putative sodium:dicarboxylate symporter family protein [Streptococcus pneumoniae]CIX91102.1 putative sodium:dicarboxylate symporter family protein [Streptococcus pneumoniae]CIZ06184.1 putative sodium:dicarboxylate symporter family protein [Streptococcus pneumoniae]
MKRIIHAWNKASLLMSCLLRFYSNLLGNSYVY